MVGKNALVDAKLDKSGLKEDIPFFKSHSLDLSSFAEVDGFFLHVFDECTIGALLELSKNISTMKRRIID